MKRSRMVPLAAATLFAALLGARAPAADPTAQPASQPAAPDEDRFEELAARYRQILQRRPRRDTAFDLWYRHYFDAGRTADLVASVEDAAREQPDDSAPQLLLALVLERQGRDDEALAAYAAAEKLARDDYYPAYARGTLLARRNEFDAAAEALARALELKPPRTEALDIAKALGRVHFRRGKTEEALRTWSDVAAQYPRDRQVLEELAALLAQEEQYDEAIRRWEQVADLVQGDPAGRLRAQIEIAQLYVEKGARNTAIEMFARALADLKPESWQAQDIRRRIEDAFLRDEDVAGLVAWCAEQVQSRPEDLESMRQLARAQALAGRRDEALQTYERAVRLAPSHKDLREALIEELVRKGEFAQAVTHGEELAKQHPADAEVLRRLGELHLEAAVPEQRAEAERNAVEVWRRIAAIRPEDPTLALQTAEACRRAGRAQWTADEKSSPLVQTAEQFYREAIRRASGAPHYHEYLGEFLHEQDRQDEAVEAWAKIAAPPNETAENCHRLSEVYARFGHLEEALQASRRSLALDPQNFRYVNDCIGLLLETKQFDEALQLVTDLQKLADDPIREEQAQARVVEVYAAAGRVADKVAELRRQLAAGDATTEDRLLLALLLMEQRAFAAARDELGTALHSAPDDVRLLRLQGNLLHETGDLAGAVAVLERLVERDPTRRVEHYTRIIQLQLDLGRPAHAKIAAEQLIESSPSSLDAYRLRARVAFQMNDPEAALATLRRALQVAPRDLDIRLELAQSLAEHRHQQEAVEHFWRCFELADSLEMKRSVIAAMSELSPSVLSHSTLIARLEQLRTRSQDSKVLTLCLVEAHRRGKRFANARQELVRLLEERRDDPDALRGLVEIARERNQWDEAVSWQQRIVELAPEPRELETLASLYAQGADPSRAVDVWLRLLKEHGDARPLLAAIDRRLSAGEFSIAATLAERAAQVAPGTWRLHQRAGYARYALKQWEPATEHFQQVRALIEPPDESLSPISQLQAAAQARSAFTQLARFADEMKRQPSARRGTAAQRTVQQRQRYSPPSLTNDPAAARLETLVALYLLAESVGQLDAWIEQGRTAARAHPQVARDMLIALFAVGRLDTLMAADTVDELAELLSDDPLLHAARLIQPVDARNLARLSPPERERRRDELQASFNWIAEHRPDLKPELLFTYGSQLNALGFAELTADLLLDELDSADNPQDLATVAALALLTHRPGFRERFTVHAAGVVGFSKTPVHPGILRMLLDVATTRGAIPPGEVDDELAAACVLLFEQYLTTSRGRQNPVRLQPSHAAIFSGSPGLVTITRSGTATGGLLVSGSLHQAQLLLDHYKRQQATLAQIKNRSGSRVSTAQRQSMEEQQQRLLQQLSSLGFGDKPEELMQEFPAAGAGLDSESFLALYRLQLWLDQADKLDRLLERLANPSVETASEQRAFELSCAFVLWWSDRREESIEIVRNLSEAVSGDVDLRLMLARAYYADARPQEALAVLDTISNPARPVAEEITRLKADAARVVSEAARLSVLRGHEHVIRALACSPDGELIASGSYDGTIRLWKPDQTHPVATLEGHKEFVFCIAFSPDGRLLASAGLDGRIFLWDVAKRELLATLTGHEASVRALDFSPNGGLLLSASDDKTVRIWEIASRVEAIRLAELPDAVLCGAFSPDGNSVATGAADKLVRLHDLDTGTIRTFPPHDGVVRAVAFSPDGRLLASGGVDNKVRIYDRTSGKPRAEYVNHSDTVFDLAFSPDGSKLASASGDHSICLFDVAEGWHLAKLTGHSNAVSSVRFLTGDRLASGSYDRTLRIWKVASKGERGTSAP